MINGNDQWSDGKMVEAKLWNGVMMKVVDGEIIIDGVVAKKLMKKLIDSAVKNSIS